MFVDTSRSLRVIVGVAVSSAALLLFAVPAFAWNEVTNVDDYGTSPFPVRTTCESCHGPDYGGGTPPANGVHGGYTATSSKCAQCHAVHEAPAGGIKLLPGPTVTATCNACHDGTGGEGVYEAIHQRTGVEPAAAHRTETTTNIPGGDATDGGDYVGAFRGLGGTLTCSDCHAIHGSNMVTAFKGDRQRTDWGLDNPTSTKLLRQKPGSVATAVLDYGTDWCLACHAGRESALSAVHNHPVESSAAVAPATPYVYRSTPVLGGAMPTTTTALGAMGSSNKGYLMPYPRTTGANGQDGHYPLCQQCHEDARFVGDLSPTGSAEASSFRTSPPLWTQPDGWNVTDNPRFQTFPHEAVNRRFLVETGDSLCLNCHPAAMLP